MIRYPQPRHKNCRGGEHNLNDADLPDNPVPNNAGNSINTPDYLDLHHARQKAYRLLSLRAHSARLELGHLRM